MPSNFTINVVLSVLNVAKNAIGCLFGGTGKGHATRSSIAVQFLQPACPGADAFSSTNS